MAGWPVLLAGRPCPTPLAGLRRIARQALLSKLRTAVEGPRDHQEDRMRNQEISTAGPSWLIQSDPSIRLILGFGAFVLAVVMLAGFYVVIQQGVARAHTHWENATRMVSSCDVGRLSSSHETCSLTSPSVRIVNLTASR